MNIEDKARGTPEAIWLLNRGILDQAIFLTWREFVLENERAYISYEECTTDAEAGVAAAEAQMIAWMTFRAIRRLTT